MESACLALAANHNYDIASGAVQIAIVLASAPIISTLAELVWITGALGIVGVAFSLIAFSRPTALHPF